MNVVRFFTNRGKLFWGLIGLALVIILGIIDYVTGYEISVALFYLIPISTVAWYGGRNLGLITAGVCALAYFLADYASGLAYSSPTIYIWNMVLWVGFFFLVAWLVSSLRKSYLLNQDLARVDYVTGAVSIRYFYEVAKAEIGRSARYKRPFSFAYFDMDNFKAINDSLGHSAGDRVLRVLTEHIQRQIRKSDTFARLGGDEFALLLPETDELEAHTLVARLHQTLLKELQKYDWKITFSVGVVTYKEPPKSVDDMVKLADSAMYSVKLESKNGVVYRVYAG